MRSAAPFLSKWTRTLVAPRPCSAHLTGPRGGVDLVRGALQAGADARVFHVLEANRLAAHAHGDRRLACVAHRHEEERGPGPLTREQATRRRKIRYLWALMRLAPFLFALFFFAGCAGSTSASDAPRPPVAAGLGAASVIGGMLDDFHDAAARADRGALLRPLHRRRGLPRHRRERALDQGRISRLRPSALRQRQGLGLPRHRASHQRRLQRERRLVRREPGDPSGSDRRAGTGVAVKQQGEWKVAQYSLSLTIPNERFAGVKELLEVKTPPPLTLQPQPPRVTRPPRMTRWKEPRSDERTRHLAERQKLKMARNAHAYVRGSTARFYEFLAGGRVARGAFRAGGVDLRRLSPRQPRSRGQRRGQGGGRAARLRSGGHRQPGARPGPPVPFRWPWPRAAPICPG